MLQENPIPKNRGADTRAAPRRNLYLAAILHAAQGGGPVKIRNMSDTGALIEASGLPPVGSNIQLVRGALHVGGHVVWASQNRAGVHFTSCIAVGDWQAQSGNREQERVDRIVAIVQGGAIPFSKIRRPTAVNEALVGPAQIRLDLERVRSMIDDLGEHLSCDPGTLERHAVKLQNLDIASQTLDVIVKLLASDTCVNPQLAARLADLRSSCAQAMR